MADQQKLPTVNQLEGRIVFFFQNAPRNHYGLGELAEVLNPIEEGKPRYPNLTERMEQALLNLRNSRLLDKNIFPPYDFVRGPNFPRSRPERD